MTSPHVSYKSSIFLEYGELSQYSIGLETMVDFDQHFAENLEKNQDVLRVFTQFITGKRVEKEDLPTMLYVEQAMYQRAVFSCTQMAVLVAVWQHINGYARRSFLLKAVKNELSYVSELLFRVNSPKIQMIKKKIIYWQNFELSSTRDDETSLGKDIKSPIEKAQ